MQCLTTITLTATMLVHAAFGCCIHHDHSCEAPCREMPVANAEKCPCSGHDNDCDPTDAASLAQSDDVGQEHSEHGPRRCDGGKCNFARTEAAPDVAPTDIGSFSSVLIPVAICLAQIADRPMRATSFEPNSALSALRRHLVLAVFLVWYC